MNNDLKIIKKNYGEKFAHLCRELFPSLLETEGLLSKIITSSFAPSHSLYDDIINNRYEEEFKNYIYSLYDVEKKELVTNKTVKSLLDEVGYDFYECHTEEDIKSFKKYYAPKETLCTFYGNRLDRCHVFWAVKKDVDIIKREDYYEPKRQDRYGTSVISIQFSRGKTNTLSIKNRYNHTVNNPDATFSNNLENIIPGLTAAFAREYGLNINQTETRSFEMPNYVRANDKRFYRYNYEFDNISYCENNVIIANGEVINLDKSRYLLIDYFIIDLKEKKVNKFDYNYDSFIDLFRPQNHDKTNYLFNTKSSIDKIEVLNELETNNKIIRFINKDNKETIIKIDKYGRIIELEDENIQEIDREFLKHNKALKKIKLPNVIKIGKLFLQSNEELTEIDLSNVEEIGEEFISNNEKIKKVNLPNVKKIKFGFLSKNKELEEIDLPKVEEIGNFFIHNNFKIRKINLPKVKIIYSQFLKNNTELTELNLPNVEEICEEFISNNEKIKKIIAPKLKLVGYKFLLKNKELEEIDLPSLEKTSFNFASENNNIKKINLPNVRKIGSYFLDQGLKLDEVNLPNLEEVDDRFLAFSTIKKLSLPHLKKAGNEFLYQSTIPPLKELDFVDKLKEVGDNTYNTFQKIAEKNKGESNEEIRNNKSR